MMGAAQSLSLQETLLAGFLPLGHVEDDADFCPTVHGRSSFWSCRPLAPSMFLPCVGHEGGSNVVASAFSYQVPFVACQFGLGNRGAVYGYCVDRGPLCLLLCGHATS